MDLDMDAMLVMRCLSSSSEEMLHKRYTDSYDSNSRNSGLVNNNEANSLLKSNTNNICDLDLSESIFTPATSDNFWCLYNLEGNIDKRAPDDVLEAAIAAVLIVKLFLCRNMKINEDQQFLKTENKKSIDQKKLGALILRLILNFQCNAHCIKELQMEPDILAIEAKLAIIGYGIYCNLSLVNHSCNPNVLHSTSGKTKFMYAIAFIKEGEEINDSYGERFVSHELEERQETIEQT